MTIEIVKIQEELKAMRQEQKEREDEIQVF